MIRLMLGTLGKPSLLVEVSNNYDPAKFDFRVINGRWGGAFENGYITIDERPKDGVVNPDTPIQILTDNQSRLRGNYQDVFANFEDEDYVAPDAKYREQDFDDFYDDVPF